MLIFLSGSDTFRGRNKLNILKDKFLKEVDPTGSGLILVDGSTISAGELINTLNATSLFARRRMIVVSGLFENKNKLIYGDVYETTRKKTKEDKKNSDQADIVVFLDEGIGKAPTKDKKKLWDLLLKQNFSEEFKLLSNTETANWVRSEFIKRGGQISTHSASYLVSVAGTNLWKLNNEIDKLLNYKTAGGKGAGSTQIDKDDVDELVEGEVDENIFLLTDAIGSKNKKLALKILDAQFSAGGSEDYILNMIIWQFKKLVQVRQALDSGLSSRRIVKQLKLHPYVAQNSIIQVRNFTLMKLKNTLNGLTEIMRASRAGEDIKINLSLLIAKI